MNHRTRNLRRRRLTGLVAGLAAVTMLAACGSGDDGAALSGDGPIRVGATPVPHAEILAFVQDNLAEEAGIEIEIVEFTDYIQPNVALAEGQIDANYFQTVPYLEEQSVAAGYDFVALPGIHLEPLGIYSSKVDSLDALPDGARVAIPNDPTNGGRALRLLAANDLLTLADTGDTSPSTRDITENPRNLQVTEIEAAQLPRSLADVDAAVINGNFAIEANLTPATDALVLEDPEGNPNVNVLVVRAGDEDDPRIVTLNDLLRSEDVREFIDSRYNGGVIAAF